MTAKSNLPRSNSCVATGGPCEPVNGRCAACASYAVTCDGSGLLYEPVSHPNIDHRDPRYVDREVECPGCPACKCESQ